MYVSYILIAMISYLALLSIYIRGFVLFSVVSSIKYVSTKGDYRTFPKMGCNLYSFKNKFAITLYVETTNGGRHLECSAIRGSLLGNRVKNMS